MSPERKLVLVNSINKLMTTCFNAGYSQAREEFTRTGFSQDEVERTAEAMGEAKSEIAQILDEI